MLLQMGVPGGLELLVVLVVTLVLYGVPLLVVVGGGYLYYRSREDTSERIESLEREVARLREALEAAEVTDDSVETDASDDA